ncbi:hypothetical protein [Piscirickettsia salmonis]|uniref:hypothetical protein n=1 Tax=Piscirickettsia salmonis TaxID=1238 RepID=UPI0012B85FD0|nr:hypothetical protein [Piscirickettsia salmonis]
MLSTPWLAAMEASFCLEALNQALEQGQPEIINSDQGRVSVATSVGILHIQ